MGKKRSKGTEPVLDSAATEKEINDIVFTMYGLSPIECDYITRYIKLSLQSL